MHKLTPYAHNEVQIALTVGQIIIALIYKNYLKFRGDRKSIDSMKGGVRIDLLLVLILTLWNLYERRENNTQSIE